MRIAPLALLALLACNEQQQYETPLPQTAFYFPQALAVRHVRAAADGAATKYDPAQTPCTPGGADDASCRTQLLVASTDFDLRYDPATGGWLTVIDVKDALDAVQGQALPVMPPVRGSAFTGDYGGELAVVDEATCPTWSTHSSSSADDVENRPLALIASRSTNALYRIQLDADGVPHCDDGCAVAVHGPKSATGEVTVQAAQPYGLAVVCGVLPQFIQPMYRDPAQGAVTDPDAIYAQRYYAFVGFLQIESSTGALAQLELNRKNLTHPTDDPMAYWRSMGIGAPHSMAYDPASTRLFSSARFAALGSSPLRVTTLASPSSGSRVFNLEQWVRGVQQRGIALSADGTRAYVALGFYDLTTAATYGAVPALDLSGGLATVDLTDLERGGGVRVTDVARMDRGMSEVRVIPRAGLGDLVVTISSTDSSLWLYDADRGAVANVFGNYGFCPPDDPTTTPPTDNSALRRQLNKNAPEPCRPGQPLVGKYPAGLAVETFADGKARIYVSSFDRYWVDVITIDPAHPEKDPESWYRLGPERT